MISGKNNFTKLISIYCDSISLLVINAHNQCQAMLYQYFHANGGNFSKLVLTEALAKAGLLAIAESHHLLEI